MDKTINKMSLERNADRLIRNPKQIASFINNIVKQGRTTVNSVFNTRKTTRTYVLRSTLLRIHTMNTETL